MPGFTNAVPVIATDSVGNTVSWFERTLGFKQEWSWGDPPVYAGITSGEAELYITEDAALFTAIRDQPLRPEIFLWVTDIDAVCAQHRARGADIIEELISRPWGVRQYVIREPNGYLLKIAESL
jgi:catechol 2,3-dioxygenase-like lactoylglutathione lyase family enzyme